VRRRAGRPTYVSPGEHEEILRAHRAGRSIREIAEAIYGSPRYKGRVERVLANQERPRDLAYEPPPEKVRAFRERFGPDEQLELIGRELTWLNDQLRASANTPDRSDA